MSNNQKVKWRKLDNSAKLFPIISTKRFSTIFRVSVVLTETIDPKKLKKATEKALATFANFKVRLRTGFFWYYLEENNREIIVYPEDRYPCRYIGYRTNNGYLFRVSYYNKKINVEVFHALTDGTTATEFVKTIVYEYLNLCHDFNEKFSAKQIQPQVQDIEDSYLKNYDKSLHFKDNTGRAYIIKGKKLLPYQAGTTQVFIDLKPIIKTCRSIKVTVTEYFTAVLIYCIYQQQKNTKDKKSIKVCIPVNLKKFFPSNTITNFFTYMTVVAKAEKIDLNNFEAILEYVREFFRDNLQKESLAKTMAHNVKLGNQILIRIIPLFIKKLILKLVYGEIQKYTTTTFSNLGKVNFLPEYEQYIQNFFFIIAPEKAEKIKCTICSYKDNIIFSVGSILQENDIEKSFAEFLEEQGIKTKIITNDIYAKEANKLYPKIDSSPLINMIKQRKQKVKNGVAFKETFKRKFHI